jgi:hypothetical protein
MTAPVTHFEIFAEEPVWVESLDAAAESVKRLGGSVLRPKTAVPKTGWYAVSKIPSAIFSQCSNQIRRRCPIRNLNNARTGETRSADNAWSAECVQPVGIVVGNPE